MPHDENCEFRPAYLVHDRQSLVRPGEVREIIGLFFVSSKKLRLNEFLAFRVRFADGSEGNVPFNEVATFLNQDYSLLSPEEIELRCKT